MTTALHTQGSTPRNGATVGRERIIFKLMSEQSDGEVAVFDVRIPPGGGPPMLTATTPSSSIACEGASSPYTSKATTVR